MGIESKVLKLTLKSIQEGHAGGGLPDLTAADVMAWLAKLPEAALLAGLVFYTSEIIRAHKIEFSPTKPGVKRPTGKEFMIYMEARERRDPMVRDLRIYVQGYLLERCFKNDWQVRGKVLYDFTCRVARLVVSEFTNDGKCIACFGTGWNATRSMVCGACKGDKTRATTGRYKASAVQMSKSSWANTWEPKLFDPTLRELYYWKGDFDRALQAKNR